VLFLKSGTIQGSVSSDVDSNVSDTLTIFPRLLGTRAGLLAVPSDVAFTLFGGSVSNLRALLLGLDDGLLISAEELPINLGPNIGRDTQQAMAALSNRPLSMLVLLGDDVRLFTRFGDSGATDPAEAAARARAATSAGSAGAGVAGPPPVLSPPPDLSGLPLENLAAATADEAIRLLTGLRPRSDLLTQSGRQVAPVATLLGGTAPADGPGPAMRPADAPPPDDLPALLINPAAPPTRPDLSSALLDPMLALPLLVRVRTLNGRDESEAAGRQR
jgi:hypothetical protein